MDIKILKQREIEYREYQKTERTLNTLELLTLKKIKQDILKPIYKRLKFEIDTCYKTGECRLDINWKKYEVKLAKIFFQFVKECFIHGYWLGYLTVTDIAKLYNYDKYISKRFAEDNRNIKSVREKLKKAIEGNIAFESLIEKEVKDEYAELVKELAKTYLKLKEKSLLENMDIAGLRETIERKKAVEKLKDVFRELKGQPSHIQTIIRTEATRAFNIGKMKFYHNTSRKTGFIKAVRYSAVMDSATTPMCRARDGLIMRLDDPRLSKNTPPLHPNCRSTLMPVTVYEKYETSKEWKDVMVEYPPVENDIYSKFKNKVVGKYLKFK